MGPVGPMAGGRQAHGQQINLTSNVKNTNVGPAGPIGPLGSIGLMAGGQRRRPAGGQRAAGEWQLAGSGRNQRHSENAGTK